jgi:hypothetical protein
MKLKNIAVCDELSSVSEKVHTQRTASRSRHAAPMHEMVMAAIMPPPPPSSSELP